MPKSLPIIFLIITIGIIVLVLNFSPIPVPVPGVKPNSSENSNTINAYPTYYSGPRPETVIVNGPKDWEIISDTPSVVFQFVAIWNGDFRDILFETKVDEIDKDWQLTYGNSRTIELLPGEHTYHFSVRAKTKDGIEDYTPASRTFIGKTSSLVKQIKIISLNSKANPQKLVLYNSDGNINISNWTIESSFKKITFSEGVRLFRPDSRTIYENINLNSGDYLYLIGQSSPLNFNFYLNRCFGYLTYSYNFNSIFSKDCPRPTSAEISYFSSECQQFINNLNVCQIPSVNDINKFNNDPACQQFLNDYYNYSSCVNHYQSSPDFYKKEWYVFTNDQFTNPDHDKIILKDEDGNVVDVYEY